MPKIRKAIIPAAGRGTRLLPLTKAQPKELLAVVGRPLIQYIVEEAVASGIHEVIIVTAPGKKSIEQYFRKDPALVRYLEKRGLEREASLVRRISSLADIQYVQQDESRGLGHAVFVARRAVGSEPVAVLLPDDLMDGAVPCTAQLLQAWRRHPGAIVATKRAPKHALRHSGVLALDTCKPNRRVFRVLDVVEKPSPQQAPSDYIIVGRYILPPEIFEVLAATPPGRNHEIQLTDGLKLLLERQPMYAVQFTGCHIDAGNFRGLLEANLHFARKDRQLARILKSARP